MKLSELTSKQRDSICKYFMDKYAPIDKDHMRRQIYKACEHCPFGVGNGMGSAECGEWLFDSELDEELNTIIKIKSVIKRKDTKK